MDKVEALITIISTILGFVASFTGVLVACVKNIKARKYLEATSKLATALQEFVIEAESLDNFSGEEKKSYVLTKANRYAIENKLPYNEQDVGQVVENLIKVSKEVNKRGTASRADKQGALLGDSQLGKIYIK